VTKNIKLIKDQSNYTRFLPTTYPSEIQIDEPLVNDCLRHSFFLQYQHIYFVRKHPNKAYKIIFFSLSLIFLSLSFAIYFKTANYACGLFFGDCTLFKQAVEGSCFLLSLFTFGLGYLSQPEVQLSRHKLTLN
jgi:hypothetical protein